jgi:hypothetical protein
MVLCHAERALCGQGSRNSDMSVDGFTGGVPVVGPSAKRGPIMSRYPCALDEDDEPDFEPDIDDEDDDDEDDEDFPDDTDEDDDE